MKAIIIGATSGIGRAITEQLAAKGWQLGIAGRRISILQEMQSKNLNIIATQEIDVTNGNAVAGLNSLIGKMGGDVDLFLHSSGIGYQNVELDAEKELATVMTNALGMTRMVIAMFNYYVQRPELKGQIAVISSIAGTKGLGAAPAYSSTKRYTRHYLECLSQLIHIRGIKNITITDIRPGFVRTPLLKGDNYPVQLDVNDAARDILKGVLAKKSVVTVDWKYRILVFFWSLVPRWIWVRMSIATTAPTRSDNGGHE